MKGEDRATLQFLTAERRTVTLQANLAVHGAPPTLTDQLRIIGEDGTITLDGPAFESRGCASRAS